MYYTISEKEATLQCLTKGVYISQIAFLTEFVLGVIKDLIIWEKSMCVCVCST